jgi:Asp/Glu/hydantoin racemase
MTSRFMDLAEYAVDAGAHGILFTCSAFGPCIDAVARRWPDIPVLKPNEAMIAEASRIGPRVGLVGSFAPTLVSMPAEFPVHVTVLPVLAEGALDALTLGDTGLHDHLVVQAARRVAARGCDVVALGQFSLARAASLVEQAIPVPVLTTVGSAVRLLRDRVERATIP